MGIVLLTTTDVAGPRGADFDRLLASLAAAARQGADVRHYALLQNCTPAALQARRAAAPSWCRLSAVPGRLSLSEARNRLLAQLHAEQPPGPGDIVGFPDDDCWMPDGFPARLASAFAARPELDWLLCRSDLVPEASQADLRAEPAATPATTRHAVRLATSNTLFLRGPVCAAVGLFDPNLGLGTPAGGGEDTDYAVRAFLRAREAVFVDRALVGHPAPDRASAAKYYRGALLVLAAHAGASRPLALEFLRKILVGLYFVATGRLAPAAYGRALREALPRLLRPRSADRAAAAGEPVLAGRGGSRP